METLAYLHLALAHEDPINDESGFILDSHKLFDGLNWKKLSSCAWVYMLPLAVALSLLGMTSPALAALQEGDNSPEVTALQQRLQNLGYLKARASGYFGTLTKEAVIQFQKAKGLTPDGVVGAQTQAALAENTQLSMSLAKTSVRTTKTNTPRSRTTTRPRTRTNQPQVSQRSNSFLGMGSSGQEVQALQEVLRGTGHYRGPINGVFDANTEAAVRRFQQTKRLTVDGVVGPQTRAALPAVGGSSPISERKPRVNVTARKTSPTVTEQRTNPNVLIQGQTSQAVVDLQRRLRELSYFRGRLTGSFDGETKEAVIEFQKDHNLPADGVVGTNTSSVLQKVSERSAVANLQKRLKEKGFYEGSSHGEFDRQTREAIEAAQRAYGLSEDDIVNKRF